LHQYIDTKREKGGKSIWILFSSIIITVAGVPVACSPLPAPCSHAVLIRVLGLTEQYWDRCKI
jgi:hypothetical protein